MQNLYSTKSPIPTKLSTRGSNEVWEDNEVISSTHSPYYTVARKDGCTDIALQAMGDRLVDWFSVIMASNKKKPTSYKGKLGSERLLRANIFCFFYLLFKIYFNLFSNIRTGLAGYFNDLIFLTCFKFNPSVCTRLFRLQTSLFHSDISPIKQFLSGSI